MNSKPKKGSGRETSRACAQAAEEKLANIIKTEPSVRKIIRKAAVLADLMTGEDIEADARVIREATQAETRIYDVDNKQWLAFPDHKTRLAATTLRRAYTEGLPVKRQITLTGTFASAEEVLERLRSSPEAMKAIAGAGVALEIGGEIIDNESEKVEDEDV